LKKKWKKKQVQVQENTAQKGESVEVEKVKKGGGKAG